MLFFHVDQLSLQIAPQVVFLLLCHISLLSISVQTKTESLIYSFSKRIFLLGPSHHFYLSKAALSKCTHYATPLGKLTVDRETTAALHKTGQFEWMSQSVDEDEHSLEMHLPYIYKTLTKYATLPTLEP